MTLTRTRSGSRSNALHAMRQRCYNPKNHNYPHYGGRGIIVCDRWMINEPRGEGYRNFKNDMGPRPPGMTLDRIDNDGPYSPENCRWATQKEQNRNTRLTTFLTAKGKTQSLADWADEIGVPRYRLVSRYQAGWPPEKILSTEKFNRHNSPGVANA